MNGVAVFVRGQERHHVAEVEASALLVADALQVASVVAAADESEEPA